MTANDLWKFTCLCLKTPGVRSYHVLRAPWILWVSNASRKDSEENQFDVLSVSFIYTFQLDTERKTLALFRTSLFQTCFESLSVIIQYFPSVTHFLKFPFVFTLSTTWVHQGLFAKLELVDILQITNPESQNNTVSKDGDSCLSSFLLPDTAQISRSSVRVTKSHWTKQITAPNLNTFFSHILVHFLYLWGNIFWYLMNFWDLIWRSLLWTGLSFFFFFFST